MKLFSQNIYKIRKKWRLSQAEMAKMFGITTTSYGRWEDTAEPPYESLVQLATFFRTSIDMLLTKELSDDDIPHRWGEGRLTLIPSSTAEEPPPPPYNASAPLLAELLRQLDDARKRIEALELKVAAVEVDGVMLAREVKELREGG